MYPEFQMIHCLTGGRVGVLILGLLIFQNVSDGPYVLLQGGIFRSGELMNASAANYEDMIDEPTELRVAGKRYPGCPHLVEDEALNTALKMQLENRARQWIAPQVLGPVPDEPNEILFFKFEPGKFATDRWVSLVKQRHDSFEGRQRLPVS